MKTIKCINNEKFNFITIGEDYIVEKETRDFYYIRNNSGIRKRYGKSHFDDNTIKPKPTKKIVKEIKSKKIVESIATCIFVKQGLSYKKKYAYTASKDDTRITVTNDNGEKLSVLKKRFTF